MEHALPAGWNVVAGPAAPGTRPGPCARCHQTTSTAHVDNTDCLEALLWQASRLDRQRRRIGRQLSLLETELHRVRDEWGGGAQALERALMLVEETADVLAAAEDGRA